MRGSAEQRSAGKNRTLCGNPCGQSNSGMEGEPWGKENPVKDRAVCLQSSTGKGQSEQCREA